jgi:hypothetical protein
MKKAARCGSRVGAYVSFNQSTSCALTLLIRPVLPVLIRPDIMESNTDSGGQTVRDEAGRHRRGRGILLQRWWLAAAALALLVLALAASRVSTTSAQAPSLCTELSELLCGYGIPYPINSSLAAPYAGLQGLERLLYRLLLPEAGSHSNNDSMHPRVRHALGVLQAARSGRRDLGF